MLPQTRCFFSPLIEALHWESCEHVLGLWDSSNAGANPLTAIALRISSSYQIVMLHLYKRLRWDEGDSDPPLPPSSANFPPHLHHHNLPLLLQPLLCVPEANNSWPVIYFVFHRQEYNNWMLNIISYYQDCTWHHFSTPSFEGLQIVQGLHRSFILFTEKHSTFWRWNRLRKHTCVSFRIPLR